ncbi:hypothetical protein SAMN05444143_11129 [Flavobacterium succinicans]|uniref:Sugar phosphate permease n=1 Tax=Flavobacterium succinicans TaxID=29536 RepID=A0A1I4YAL8_9FLAO|nr:DUF5690 family protein [Flavobacterium succinicans]SFN35055.1 hypothetical protein SAMN05444143_11129 [Flavobacterium succinicans]
MRNTKTKNNWYVPKAAFAAFGVYFCMYAFRKPFTIASFEGITYWGVDYKVLLIIAQVMGYFLSKFIGIKIVSELKEKDRLKFLFGFIAFAFLTLLGFALTPRPYNIFFMFLNGLPLGMIWGIVFSYIEGRKATEILGLILCTSFVVSSGFVKSVGKFTMSYFGVTEFWMPFLTGLWFIIPLVFFGLLLDRLPKPSKEDIAYKTKRVPLNQKERKKLILTFWVPLFCLTILYISLTILRDFRDNFTGEIWDALGFKDAVSLYTYAEIPIAFTVLLVLSFMVTIKNNTKAFLIYHYILLTGVLIIGLSTIAYSSHLLSPMPWMIITGIGMYLCYIPFNGLFFDRMIATFKIKGNVGFLIYFVDSFGYLGSILILLFKNFGYKKISWLHFYIQLNYVIAIIGFFTIIMAAVLFQRKINKMNSAATSIEEETTFQLQELN